VLPGIAARGIPGYQGAHLFRRTLPDEVEFMTVMWFDSIENVKDFMGVEYETAYVPPQARALLARYDDRSIHFDVCLEPNPTSI